jgi:hypothetical protein
MKLNENTLTTLKNFATINSSLYLQAGNQQKTINSDKTVLGEAIIQDSFPVSFGIYDLPQFLANVSTLNNPDIDFKEKHLTMSDGSVRLSYYYCSPSIINVPPTKTLEIVKPDVNFFLAYTDFQKLIKIASLNNMPNLSVVGKNNEILLKTHEKYNDSSNFANLKIADYSGKDFDISFQISNLKMLPDDYNVAINLAGFALFENKNKTLKYFVALEKDKK